MVKNDEKIKSLREQFKEYYDLNLKADYEAIDKIRKSKAVFFYVSFVFCFIYIFFTFKISFLSGKVFKDVDFLLFFILLCIAYFWCKFIFLSFKKDTKDIIRDKIISFVGNVVNVENKQIIYDSFYKSNIYPISSYSPSIDDCFLIKRNNANVYVSDFKVEYSGKVRETVFKGIGILVDCTKKFKGKTIVTVKNNYFSLFVMLPISFVFSAILVANLYKDFVLVKKYFIYFGLILWGGFYLLVYYVPCIRNFFQKRRGASLEDVVFAKNWDINTTDQIEARYLLTPTLMNNILLIKKLYGGKSVEFSFFDNKFFILINTEKDMFETVSLFRRADDVDRVFKVVEQFYSIFQIIDLLKIEGKKNNEKS